MTGNVVLVDRHELATGRHVTGGHRHQHVTNILLQVDQVGQSAQHLHADLQFALTGEGADDLPEPVGRLEEDVHNVGTLHGIQVQLQQLFGTVYEMGKDDRTSQQCVDVLQLAVVAMELENANDVERGRQSGDYRTSSVEERVV